MTVTGWEALESSSSSGRSRRIATAADQRRARALRPRAGAGKLRPVARGSQDRPAVCTTLAEVPGAPRTFAPGGPRPIIRSPLTFPLPDPPRAAGRGGSHPRDRAAAQATEMLDMSSHRTAASPVTDPGRLAAPAPRRRPAPGAGAAPALALAQALLLGALLVAQPVTVW